MSILPCEPSDPIREGEGSSMLPQDMKLTGHAGLWKEMPIHIKSTSSDAGRAQLLYGWLHITGMDEMNEIKGIW
jgi:hypothetical protein